jgi:hypothetical protein
MLSRWRPVADTHKSAQDATYGPPPYGKAEDTPLRHARTLASGAS